MKWRDAGLILTATLVAANWRLLTGHAYEKWDAFDFFSPYYSLVADFARAGRLLYWNPWTNGGSPDFAEPQVGAFSPILLLFAEIAGGSAKAFRIYWITIWLAGGLGMLFLARHLRAPVCGGLVVALGFLFSGFYTGHAEHTSVLYSYSFLPFVIWRFDVAICHKHLLGAAQAGALWGLSALAGNPALTIGAVGLLISWGIGRSFFSGKEATSHSSWKQALISLGILGAVGVFVLSPTYFGFAYEGRGYSDRSEPLARAFALGSNALHPGALATLSSPSLATLRFFDPTLWSYTDISGINLYTGALTVVLAVVALLGGIRQRWRWFLFSLGLLFVGCAFSRVLPLRGWLYDLLPPTRYFRHSSMFRGYFMFLLSILALYGSREIWQWRSNPTILRKVAIVAPILAFAAAIAFAMVRFSVEVENPDSLLATVHFCLVWGGLTLAVLASYRAPTRVAPFLSAGLLGLALIDGIMSCRLNQEILYDSGPSPESIAPHRASIALKTSDFQRAFSAPRANLNLFSKVPTLKGYAAFKNRFHEATVVNADVAPMALGEHRVWFAQEAPEVPWTNASFKKFSERVQMLRTPIIALHSHEALMHPERFERPASALAMVQPAIEVPFQIVSYSPDKLMLIAETPENGWLMVTDRWSRSWLATVNGTTKPVACADFIYRAVPVCKGTNRIVFSFEPVAMPALIIVSWTTLFLVGSLTLIISPRQRSVNRLAEHGTKPAQSNVFQHGLEPLSANVSASTP